MVKHTGGGLRTSAVPTGRTSRRGFLETAVRSAGVVPVALAGCSLRRPAESTTHKAPVIDTHMHVWADDPQRFPFRHPYNADYKGPEQPGTVEMLIDDMDANGQTHCVLVQVIFHGWDNEYIVHCIERFPRRLKAHGLIDPTDPNVADKLAYWVTERGLAGMRFSAIYYRDGRNGGDAWLTSEAHETLWKKAAGLGAVFNWFIATQQLPKLEVMIQRHPDVRVIVDHLSQADLKAEDPMPEFHKLLALARYPNVWVKISELTSVSKSGTYPFEDAWPWVKRVYEAFGPDRLLWGTGYPGAARADYKRPTLAKEIALIRKEIPFFTPEDRERILGRNAFHLWGFGGGR